MRPKRTAGFTLIELMIAMVVVAILTAIAIPSYQTYVRQSRRPDAKQGLLDLAAREERYYTVNNTYTGSATALGYATANFPINLGTSMQDYALSVTASSATAYTLQALPLNDQLNDSCGGYQLDNLGNQLNIYPANTAGTTIAGCW